ncbi:MFS transporter [Rhodococcus erythropolis]
MTSTTLEPVSGLRDITKRQWATLAGTTGGWGMEGFDVAIFALVVGPAVTDLLGPGATPDQIIFHAGLAITVFLAAWALGAIVFGILADHFGRVRILTIGILLYAVFTALTALSHEYWLLLLFRFFAGLGSGVEAPVGATLMSETWNNRYRARAIGIMMSGYAAGYFLASWVYGLLGQHGWRITLSVAVLPALLVLFIRRFVREPEVMVRLQEDRKALRQNNDDGPLCAQPSGTAVERDDDPTTFALRRLFKRPLLRPTIAATLIQVGALFSFWATSTWTPQIIREISIADGLDAQTTAANVTNATAMLTLGGFIGYATWGFIADWIGRRGAFLFSFSVSAVSVGFLYPMDHAYSTFLWVLPVVGFGIFGALAGPSVYLPEIFPVGVRASALSLTNSFARIFTAPGPLVAGSIAATYFAGDLGSAVTIMNLFLIVGVIGVLIGRETRNSYREARPSATADPTLTPTD